MMPLLAAVQLMCWTQNDASLAFNVTGHALCYSSDTKNDQLTVSHHHINGTRRETMDSEVVVTKVGRFHFDRRNLSRRDRIRVFEVGLMEVGEFDSSTVSAPANQM